MAESGKGEGHPRVAFDWKAPEIYSQTSLVVGWDKFGAAKISRTPIGTSRRNTTGSDLLGRRNTAFERRVVPEDQHENSREEREERDGQQPGGEPPGRILQ